MRTVDKLIERLALLASGEMPIRAEHGICFDLYSSVSNMAEHIFGAALEEMGLCPVQPIGSHYRNYGLEPAWTGRKGKLRRALCKRTVFHLVQRHGYKGNWT